MNLKGIACNDIQTNSPAASNTSGTDRAACSMACSTRGAQQHLLEAHCGPDTGFCVTRVNHHTQYEDLVPASGGAWKHLHLPFPAW